VREFVTSHESVLQSVEAGIDVWLLTEGPEDAGDVEEHQRTFGPDAFWSRSR
jgi:hypothetical protein